MSKLVWADREGGRRYRRVHCKELGLSLHIKPLGQNRWVFIGTLSDDRWDMEAPDIIDMWLFEVDGGVQEANERFEEVLENDDQVFTAIFKHVDAENKRADMKRAEADDIGETARHVSDWARTKQKELTGES